MLFLAVALTGAARAQGPVIRINQIDVSGFPRMGVYLSVLDASGQSVKGLKASDFDVLVDAGRGQDVSAASVSDLGEGITVALAVDRSGSMKGEPLDAARKAALEFVSRMGTSDLIGLVVFDDVVTNTVPFTRDRNQLAAAIQGIRINGNTALFDAVDQCLTLLDLAGTRRRSVVILTDGKDTRSKLGQAQCVDRAKMAGISVFTIGLGKGADRAVLELLARTSGGQFFFAPDPSGLIRIYGRIAGNLTNQYKLSFKADLDPTIATHDLLCAVRIGADSVSDKQAFQSPLDLSLNSEPGRRDMGETATAPVAFVPEVSYGVPAAAAESAYGGVPGYAPSMVETAPGSAAFGDGPGFLSIVLPIGGIMLGIVLGLWLAIVIRSRMNAGVEVVGILVLLIAAFFGLVGGLLSMLVA